MIFFFRSLQSKSPVSLTSPSKIGFVPHQPWKNIVKDGSDCSKDCIVGFCCLSCKSLFNLKVSWVTYRRLRKTCDILNSINFFLQFLRKLKYFLHPGAVFRVTSIAFLEINLKFDYSSNIFLIEDMCINDNIVTWNPLPVSSFYCQVVEWVPVMFCNFYLVKNHQFEIFRIFFYVRPEVKRVFVLVLRRQKS